MKRIRPSFPVNSCRRRLCFRYAVSDFRGKQASFTINTILQRQWPSAWNYFIVRSFTANNGFPRNDEDSNSGGDKERRESRIPSPSPKRHDFQASDPPVSAWVENYLPVSWQPYAQLARMDKPIGTMLLLWPCFWSTALAAPAASLPDASLLALFATGAVVMRGAGCTINDLWDQDVDAAVRRTATRPLAAGKLSRTQAWGFLALQLTTGLAVLVSLPHTWYCFQWGAASLPLVAIYPAMKRFFPFPQLVLGLTFNWGAWMGWAAVHGSMDYSIVAPLYGSGVTWTLVYDTIYAHQDKEDDAMLGLQSTALTFGESKTTQKGILHGLAALTWMQWLWVGQQAELATAVYGLGATAAYGHLIWQIHTADFEVPRNLAERFRSNSTVGAILFASLTMGAYFSQIGS